MTNFGLEYHLVHSCNLRCAGCSHYSSLLDELTYPSLETITSDLTLLKDKVGDNLRWLRLLGGEPLLHPQLTKCLHTIRGLFPHAQLTIVTNGLLLNKMPQEFYDVCKKGQIAIQVSDYEVNDSEALKKWLQNKRIHAWSYSAKWRYQSIRMTGQCIDCFGKCVYKKKCNNYRDGKIYLCPRIAYIDFFNNRFGTNIRLNESDYISLNDIGSFEELQERLEAARPDFCYKYCNPTPIVGAWKRTNHDINEFCLTK